MLLALIGCFEISRTGRVADESESSRSKALLYRLIQQVIESEKTQQSSRDIPVERRDGKKEKPPLSRRITGRLTLEGEDSWLSGCI